MADDIRTIADAELEADRLASLADADLCWLALWAGVEAPGGVPAVERLIVNLAVARTIAAEQARRAAERSGRGEDVA